MHETGIVKSIDGMNARVLIRRGSSPCENCTQETCTVPSEGIETDALNAAGAQVGQTVKIVMESYTYFKGAVLVYIVPLIALITGAVLGNIYLPPFFTGVDSDLLAAAAGFSALLASFVVVKMILSRLEKSSATRSVIESIVND